MSLFDNPTKLGFTLQEISEVKAWRSALRAAGREGQAIDKNCQLETRVNDDIRAKFLRNILKQFAKKQEPIDAIRNAVSKTNNPANPDPLLLRGPEVRINLPDWFGRLISYCSIRSIRRFSKRDRADLMDEYIIPSETEVESGKEIDPQNLPDEPYCNECGFVWAVGANVLDPNPRIDELRCRLGLSHFEKNTLLLKMVYPRALARDKCLFPTVVEGRNGSSFQPADPDADAGYTRDLRDNSARYPEWVHGAIPMRQVKSIGPAVRGKSRVPDGTVLDGYLQVKLVEEKN